MISGKSFSWESYKYLCQARKLVRLWATNFWMTQKINNLQIHYPNIYPPHHLFPHPDTSDKHLQHHLNHSVLRLWRPFHRLYNIFQLVLHRDLIACRHLHKNHHCKNLHPRSLLYSFTSIIHCKCTSLSQLWVDHLGKCICFAGRLLIIGKYWIWDGHSILINGGYVTVDFVGSVSSFLLNLLKTVLIQ